MKGDHPLRKRYEQELAEQRDVLERLRNGRLEVGEKTKENPQWTDTTNRAIAQAERVIAMYEGILGEPDADDEALRPDELNASNDE